MTEAEFLHRYHDFQTLSEDDATLEAASIPLDDGSHPVVVGLPFGDTTRWCLMLAKAAQMVVDIYGSAGNLAAPVELAPDETARAEPW